MSAATARAVALIAGLLLLAGGLYGLGLWSNLPLAHSLSRRMDRLWYFTAAQQPWWPWALGGAAALCLVIGAGLVVAMVRPRPHRTVELARRSLGLLTVSPAAVGGAIASSLEGVEGVLSAQSSSRMVRGIPTLSIDVRISPYTELAPLRSLLESTAAHAAASFGPNSPSYRFIIQVDKT